MSAEARKGLGPIPRKQTGVVAKPGSKMAAISAQELFGEDLESVKRRTAKQTIPAARSTEAPPQPKAQQAAPSSMPVAAVPPAEGQSSIRLHGSSSISQRTAAVAAQADQETPTQVSETSHGHAMPASQASPEHAEAFGEAHPAKTPTVPPPAPPSSSLAAHRSAPLGMLDFDDDVQVPDVIVPLPVAANLSASHRSPSPMATSELDQDFFASPMGDSPHVSQDNGASLSKPAHPQDTQALSAAERQLGEVLWRQGVITREEVQARIRESDPDELRPDVLKLLEASGFVPSSELFRVLLAHESIPDIDFDLLDPTPQALSEIQPAVARAYRVIPVASLGELLLIAAGTDFDAGKMGELRQLLGRKLKLLRLSENDLKQALETWYPIAAAPARPSRKLSPASGIRKATGKLSRRIREIDSHEAKSTSDSAPTVRHERADIPGEWGAQEAEDIMATPRSRSQTDEALRAALKEDTAALRRAIQKEPRIRPRRPAEQEARAQSHELDMLELDLSALDDPGTGKDHRAGEDTELELDVILDEDPFTDNR